LEISGNGECPLLKAIYQPAMSNFFRQPNVQLSPRWRQRDYACDAPEALLERE